MRPQLCGALEEDWATGAEPWLAGAGDHISISSPRSPEVSGPKGLALREKSLHAPEPLSVFSAAWVPSIPFTTVSRQGPSAAWKRLTFLSFPEEGAPSGAAGGTERQNYAYQKCKMGLWKPAPPTRTRLAPPPPTGGEVTSGQERQGKLPRPTPAIEILHEGNLRRPRP